MRCLSLAALLLTAVPWVSAQRMAANSAHIARTYLPGAPGAIRSVAPRAGFDTFRRFRGPNSLWSPFGIFTDSYPLSNSPSSAEAVPAFFLQALSGAEARESQPQAPSQSLLIELQGDRYVRVKTDESVAEPDLVSARVTAPVANKISVVRDKSPATRAELEPVTLLFRDGHNENVREYTIADGALYVRGDYYSDGYWIKKIELSALDLPATIKSNQLRGVNFAIPSAPNEVLTRP
jgi:hypothetical protein